MAGEGAMAVAWSGCQRAAAPNTEWTPIYFDCDRLFLEVGGSCADTVVPPYTCGGAHRGHHQTLWIPNKNPLQIAS